MAGRHFQSVGASQIATGVLLTMFQLAIVAPQRASAQTNVQALNALSADLAKRFEKEHAAGTVCP